MTTRAARQIREGILLARQVNRNERIGLRRRPRAFLTSKAYLITLRPSKRPLWAYGPW